MAWVVERRLASLLLCASLTSAPALADDTATTGIVAGLGLSAAGGKTTLGANAGSIEASLLLSDALLKSGRTIHRLLPIKYMVDGHGKNVLDGLSRPIRRPVLIVGKTDAIDLTLVRWLPVRMADIYAHAVAVQKSKACVKKRELDEITTIRSKVEGREFAGSNSGPSTTKKFGLAKTDIVAAVATDVTINPITLNADDRQLMNAIQMDNNDGTNSTDSLWRDADDAKIGTASASDPNIMIAADFASANPNHNPVILQLRQLQSWADSYRHCDSDDYKATVDVIDKFVSGVTAADKGTPSIALAAELNDVASRDPLILRVAVDQIGGTSITRSNIWYALGYPGAAQISSGLQVDFRLSDPGLGHDLAIGIIRCAVAPVNLRTIARRIVPRTTTDGSSTNRLPAAKVTCGYRLS